CSSDLPIVLMLGWVVAPPKERIPFRRALWWLAFPLIWVVFTMIRGAIDGRYPYPFLDPANGGYGIVSVYIVAITLLFVFVCWVVAAAGSILRRRRVDALGRAGHEIPSSGREEMTAPSGGRPRDWGYLSTRAAIARSHSGPVRWMVAVASTRTHQRSPHSSE